MSLVDYMLSDEEESYSDSYRECPAKKRCEDANCTVESQTAMSDNDKEDKTNAPHKGRVRAFAHERGNWATFIYVPIPFGDSIRELQSRIAGNFENDSGVQLHFIESLHISLTRTVVIQHHWIDDFKKSVRERTIDLKKFTININMLNVYCNDDASTTFVAIAVPDVYCAPLKHLVELFDNCLGEYKLPSFYKDASFHVSILWCLGDKKSKILMEIDKLQQMLLEAIDDDSDDYQILVDRIQCKIGNTVHNYPLLT